jgi:broad specificity phosphatase PhoE
MRRALPLLLAPLLLIGCERRDTPPKQTVCVVRHAHSYKNVAPQPDNMSAQQLDRLTPQGEEQAIALAEELKHLKAWQVYSSGAGRAMDTALLIAAGAGVTPDARLSSLGGDVSWEARVEAAARGEDLAPEGSESLAQGAARVRALLAETREMNTTDPLIIVTHGDIAALTLGELAGTPLLERPARHVVETGGHVCVSR